MIVPRPRASFTRRVAKAARPVALLALGAGCGARTSLNASDAGGEPAPASPALRPPPREVSATQTLEAEVRVTWLPPVDARPSEYRVLRDGSVIAAVAAPVSVYDDTAVSPGALGAPAQLTASQGTRTDGVELRWSPPATALPGDAHGYSVVAIYGDWPSATPPPVTGRRAAPQVVGYDLNRDGDAQWSPLDDVQDYVDTGAPAAIFQAGTARATAYVVPEGAVALHVDDSTSADAPVDYRIRARSASGAGDSTPASTGFRKLAPLDYQWQRSAGDGDAAYADLPGVTGVAWYDAGIPAGVARYYRARVSAAGSTGVYSAPARVQSQPGVAQVASGGLYTCAITIDGHLVCWGDNAYGRAPPGPSTDAFTSVAAGSYSACAIRTDGHVMCWGANDQGEAPSGPSSGVYKAIAQGAGFNCGIALDDTVLCQGQFSQQQADVPTPPGAFSALAAGDDTVCGVHTDGQVDCWGRIGGFAPPPGRFAAIALSDDFDRFAVTADGSLRSWRWDSAPEGDVPPGSEGLAFTEVAPYCALEKGGSLFRWGVPSRVPGPPQGAAVYKRLAGPCAVRDDDKLVCWGDNSVGQSPVLPSGDAFVDVAVALDKVCGLRQDGTLQCAGTNGYGSATPPAAPGQRYVAVAAGSYSSCAIQDDQQLVCWGQGLTDFGAPYALPPDGAAADRFTAVAAGTSHTCALRTDGKVLCWGDDTFHQAPAGPSADSYVQLVAGDAHTCALRSDGTPVCWGDGGAAQVPSSATGCVAIAAGFGHTCALRSDHRMVCWGNDSQGQAPAGPTDLPGVTALAAGETYTCGLHDDGRFQCWGTGLRGEAPGEPSRGAYRVLRAGAHTTCGIRTDDRLICWGLGYQGQGGSQLVPP